MPQLIEAVASVLDIDDEIIVVVLPFTNWIMDMYLM